MFIDDGIDNLDSKNFICLENFEKYDVRTLTSAFKSILRDRQEPLIQYNNYEKLKSSNVKDISSKQEEIKNVIYDMNDTKYLIIKSVIRHLVKVKHYTEENLMTSKNLSICFGPCLIHPKNFSFIDISNIKSANYIIEFLINNFDQIFIDEKKDYYNTLKKNDKTKSSQDETHISQESNSTENDTSCLERSTTEHIACVEPTTERLENLN
ncbi:hypothetical protein A3Q56_08430 [Intoshia linei]|uniref:Rho-GAP domain-containing protein n=1 Tax=Intoshia linei TaxID=1819745 RepID=A0A177APB4_9BILA|nr:hypothetical protein A3Q56_08430 [Intoshia linei]